jgi:hypothetical protein
MANVLALLSISQVDYLGTKASHDVYCSIPDTKTVANLSTFMTDYLGFYGLMTGAQGLDAQIKLHLPLTGMPTSPVAGQENEKTGLFTFNQASTRYVAAIDVPAINETLIVDGKIDLTPAGTVDGWLSFLESTPDGITIVGKFNNAITTLRTAALTFRKHRRSLNRTSTETG